MGRRGWAVVLVGAVLLVGCVADEDGDETADDAGGEEAITEDGPLTDSAPGVTAETVTVGVTYPDVEALRESGLADLNHGDYELAWQAAIDRLNGAGGINGRQVEAVYAPHDLIDPLAQEETCARMVSDTEVFAVLGGFNGEANLCFTEINDTVVVGGTGLNEERQDRSAVPWLQTAERDDVTSRALIQALDANGDLDGATVGITGPTAAQSLVDDALVPTLSEAGVDPVVAMNDADSGDVEALRANYGVIGERFEADGVDLVITVADLLVALEEFDARGYGPRFATPDSQVLLGSRRGVSDPAMLDGIVTVSGPNDIDYWESEDLRAECVEPFAEAHPEVADEIVDPNDVEPGEPLWIVPLQRSCRELQLFAAVAGAAGTDLTNESFAAALDGFGAIDLLATEAASLDTDKWGANDAFRLKVMDASVGAVGNLVSQGDPIVVEG